MAASSDLLSSASCNPPMTSVELNGKNYVLWAKSVGIILKAKGFGSHLVKDKPKDSDADFSSWEQRDAQIISLMLNCIKPHISSVDFLWLKLRLQMGTTFCIISKYFASSIASEILGSQEV